MVAVIGGGGKISLMAREIADKIGGDIARSGSILICGGRGGVMEAACFGAKKFGGLTVGILPSLDKSDANPYVDIPVTTGYGHARNALVVSSSDVIIAVDGGVGTLSEINLALCYGKPVVAVRDSGGAVNLLNEGEISQLEQIHYAGSGDAVELALSLIK